MLIIHSNCEVLPDRFMTIKLPDVVYPGRHDVVIVLDEKESVRNRKGTDARRLMKFAIAVTAFNTIDGVAYQREVRS
jgi:hypothetical protein